MREALATLERQEELRRWWLSPFGVSFGDAFLRTKEVKADPGVLARSASYTLRRCQTFWVAPEMEQLAWYAARTMPNQEFHPHDVPCPWGFLALAEPIVALDRRSKNVNVAAMAWAPMLQKPDGPTAMTLGSTTGEAEADANGVLVMLYSARDGVDEYSKTRGLADFERAQLPYYVLLGDIPMQFGRPLDRWEDNDGTIPPEAITLAVKLPVALWTLMQQRLARTEDQPLERHARRRLERAKSPLALSTVRVVTLRHMAQPTGEKREGQRAFTHRWMVRGHWRNQWLPSRKMHRQQWIAPFVKGPGDRPLVEKKIVSQWVR